MLPAEAKPYLPFFRKAGEMYSIHPLLLAALCKRESRFGTAPGYRPKGAGGTGDWTPRHGVMPPDGLGWGRGLMQIDFGSHVGWCSRVNANGAYLWALPEENIAKAAEILRANLSALREDVAAAVAAYNAGQTRVRHVLTALERMKSSEDFKVERLDGLTTGGDYVSSVLRSFREYQASQEVA
jgi:hypothetical protein